jgi:4-hydroxythreonine-4-phosphate dehydrogenase
MSIERPKIAITMGDPSGVGPEVIVGSWADIAASECQRFVVGRAKLIQRAVGLLGKPFQVQAVSAIEFSEDPNVIPVLEIGDESLDAIEACQVSAAGGEAAYLAVVTAAKFAIEGEIDALVTAPLNKAALSAAGYSIPGHTELLGELCGVGNFAMMLYLPPSEIVKGDIGLGVVHTTLHTALRNVFDELSQEAIIDKCKLAHGFGRALLAAYGINRETKVGVAALNPHGGEGGLFGDEEITMIEPAVQKAIAAGISATGPLPCDTLMHRAADGEFDNIVAMYHDQGHIALKLLGLQQAVNVTLGLPIIRTSVAHGTAYDRAWQGTAQSGSMVQAIQTAIHLARNQQLMRWTV